MAPTEESLRAPNPEWTLPVHPDAARGNPPLRCPSCGRLASADMLADLSRIPPTLRAKLGASEGAAHACDACRERWFRGRPAMRHAFYEAAGCPERTLARIRAQHPVTKGGP